MSGVHIPALHFSPAPQPRHAAPPAPHAVAVWPSWHTSLWSQQPAQLLALHRAATEPPPAPPPVPSLGPVPEQLKRTKPDMMVSRSAERMRALSPKVAWGASGRTGAFGLKNKKDNPADREPSPETELEVVASEVGTGRQSQRS